MKTWAQTAFVLLSAVATLAIVAPRIAAAQSAAGAYCDQSTPCGSGFYCATDTSSPMCGAGVCTASPRYCPSLWTVGECTCDGNWIINALCAEVHGLAVEGPRAIAGAAVSDIVGTWSRVVSQTNGVETDETLTVNADGTYSFADTTRCLPAPGKFCFQSIRVTEKATGTISAAANGGFLMNETCVIGDCSTLATEAILVHNCGDYNGALQLAITPPGNNPESTAFYLTRQ